MTIVGHGPVGEQESVVAIYRESRPVPLSELLYLKRLFTPDALDPILGGFP
jgi:hypothetical protein